MLWNKNLETGNQTVDDQHREIFKLVQKVLDADVFEDRKEKIETSLGFLSNYALEHFATEEKLMNESNYPDVTVHKGQHDKFVEEVVAFMKLFKTEGDSINISQSINGLVVTWLNEHIKGSDKEFADFYRNWGILKLATISKMAE